jgi:DNA-directed RNA polymerase specialized sigma24 family protein
VGWGWDGVIFGSLTHITYICHVTARQAIMQLYDSGELRKACLSIGGTQWADDLLQEVLLVLFEKPEAKIVEAYTAGYLRFYVVRIIMNFYSSKTTGFYSKYRHLDETAPLDFDIEDENKPKDEAPLLALEAAIERMAQGKDFPYEQKLLQLHLQLKTKKKVSRATGIPYRTVCHNLDEIYKRLKNELSNH